MISDSKLGGRIDESQFESFKRNSGLERGVVRREGTGRNTKAAKVFLTGLTGFTGFEKRGEGSTGISRRGAEAQRGNTEINTKSGNLNREISERREKRSSRGGAENAENKKNRTIRMI